MAKAKKVKKLELVVVEWIDAFSITGGGFLLNEVKEVADDRWLVRTTGFIVQETDEAITFVGSWTPSTKGHHDKFRDVHVIPTDYIQSIEILATYDCGALNYD